MVVAGSIADKRNLCRARITLVRKGLIRAAKMKDPTMFTIAVLKERLRRMNLSASGNKVELIAKLNEADSSGQWMIDAEAIVSETGEPSGDVAMAQDIGISTRRPRYPTEFSILREKERDLESRERELLQRKIELMRRENEQLRSMVQSASGTSMSAATAKVSLTNLKEILSSFGGEKGS